MTLSTLFYLLQLFCLDLLRQKFFIDTQDIDLDFWFALSTLRDFKVPVLTKLFNRLVAHLLADHSLGIVDRVI